MRYIPYKLQRLGKYLGAECLYLPYLPILNNPWIVPTTEMLTQRALTHCQILNMGGLFRDGQLRTLADLTADRDVNIMDHFLVHRTRMALVTALHPGIEELADLSPLTTIITTPDGTHLVSRLYRQAQSLRPRMGSGACAAWERDLAQSMTEKMWAYCYEQTRLVSNNYKHKLLHFKYLHRICHPCAAC